MIKIFSMLSPVKAGIAIMDRTITLPFLKDHHNHPSLYAVLDGSVYLGDAADEAEALTLIEERVGLAGRQGTGHHPGRDKNRGDNRSSGRDGNVILAHGWNDSRFSFSTSALDLLPPVFICGESLHNHLMNSGARELLRPDWKEAVDNIDDSSWVERHLPVILRLMIDIAGLDAGALARFYEMLEGRGVWYAEEMLMSSAAVIDVFREAGLLDRTSLWTAPESFREFNADERSFVKGMKIWADGALGARTAAVSMPWIDGVPGARTAGVSGKDDFDGTRLLIYSDDELSEFVAEAADAKKWLSIHSLGDLACDQVLDVLERYSDEQGILPSTRMEHCQFISLENAHRAWMLGVVLSMQPNFSVDSVRYADRLSPEMLERNNPFRMLIDEAGYVPGIDLVFGSDGMPHGQPAALENSLFPPFPGQRLTLYEFTSGYCAGAESGTMAMAVDIEKKKVSINQDESHDDRMNPDGCLRED
ncbi:MAG: amidohydrolase family protein [Candidatus Krumholzibacteria bacterium]|nr:amidohydrolase family protein [Candidatus Krumholzibacteria bacterium]